MLDKYIYQYEIVTEPMRTLASGNFLCPGLRMNTTFPLAL